jgi:ABC-type lipoprotein release transport system permease subunit
VSWFLTTFEIVSFSDPGVAAIYFISSVPFLVRWTDLLAVVAFCLVSTLAACWLPARRASRLQASEALRHQ